LNAQVCAAQIRLMREDAMTLLRERSFGGRWQSAALGVPCSCSAAQVSKGTGSLFNPLPIF
jgi:hypothetical protein